jgi:hypothetical protein
MLALNNGRSSPPVSSKTREYLRLRMVQIPRDESEEQGGLQRGVLMPFCA